MDSESKPITGFWEPLITASFLADDTLVVSCYHRINMKNYIFKYSYLEQAILSDVVTIDVNNCTSTNFPIKSFYSQATKDVYVFFRQGQGITLNPETMEYKTEQITTADLGTMYLLFDKALVTRSSNSILFFKIDEETGLWKQYKEFNNLRGQIYFIRGNIRIQVTTDEKIYFYIINRQTLLP